MKTKNGRSHFSCEFRVYNSSGNLWLEIVNYRFTALNAHDYINRVMKRHAKHGYTAEFKNVVNLDEEE